MTELKELRPSRHIDQLYTLLENTTVLTRNMKVSVFTMEEWGQCNASRTYTQINPYGDKADSVQTSDDTRVIVIHALNAYYYTCKSFEKRATLLECIPADCRLSPQDIDECIKSVGYTQPKGFAGSSTVCAITCKNGLIITGESGVLNPFGNIPALGEKISFENAKSKLWQLLGFSRMDKLTAALCNIRYNYAMELLDEVYTACSDLESYLNKTHQLCNAGNLSVLVNRLYQSAEKLRAAIEGNPQYDTPYANDLLEFAKALCEKGRETRKTLVDADDEENPNSSPC